LKRGGLLVRWFATSALAASTLTALVLASAATTETTAIAPTTTPVRDCPTKGKSLGGGTALGAAEAGWRHIIAADPVVEVQGRRYRRSRLNTPLVEVVHLGAVDYAIGPLPGVRALKRMAKKRCPTSPRASLDSVWALVYHAPLSVVCCGHSFLFAWRSKDRWHVY
jgi:hypothetical protein